MTETELDTKARLWLDMLRSARALAKEAKEDEEQAKRNLLDLLGDAEVGTIGGKKAVTRTVSVRSSVDTTRLRDEYPDVYDMVQRQTEVVSVRLAGDK